jgi:Glycosyl hydrolase family 79 C-terminal beta domain
VVRYAVLCVALLLVAVAGVAAPARARSLQAGVDDDGVLLGGGAAADDAVAEWQRLGIDSVRVQISWSRVTPDPGSDTPPPGFDPANPEDPGYHWGVIDAAVDRLSGAGIHPILMLDGPPPLWASGNPILGNPRYRPSAPAFAKFAAAVAQRYGADVDQYILWNEPNLPLWIQPQATCGQRRCSPASADTYRAMVNAAYQSIHVADPVATVLIGALAPAGGDLKTRNANMRPLTFLRALGCLDAGLRPVATGGCRGFQPALADGIAYHPHSTRNPPDQPFATADNADLASLSRIEHLLDLMQRWGRLRGTTAPLGIWLDEYGFQTNPPDKLRGVSPGRQDLYLQQAAYLAWRDPRVQLISQYLWVDEKVGGGKRYTGWQSGLHFADGRDKPALAHFAHPMWLDYARSTLWGQVRPGGAHTVQVQARLPGATTAWQPIADLTTGDDGSWSLQTALIPYASYRFVADDGVASDAMVAAQPPPPSIVGPTPEPGTGPVVDRRIAATAPGAAIPPSFAGMSIEYWSVADYIGSAGTINPIFARLVGALAAGGHGPPTLRFGGNSTDETWWNPGGAPRPVTVTTDVTADWLVALRKWERRTHTPLVLGLNLGLADPGNAAQLAHAAVGLLPRGSVVTFELGNEPDRYGQPLTFHVSGRRLARVQKRPSDYDYPQYRDEIGAYVGAVGPAAPGTVLSAGGFASTAWEDHEDDLLGTQGLPVFSTHAYALGTCGGAARRRGANYYTSRLLNGRTYQPLVSRAAQLSAVAAAHGAAVRVSESNTAICGGVHRGSDTFAAALWATDVLFGMAEAGVRNVDFHTWTGSWYAPVDFIRLHGRLVGRVRPLFYAMLLFDRATPAGARLLAMGPNPPNAQLKSWATVDPAGTRRIVLVNKDFRRAHKVVLRVPGGGSRGRVERLLAPSVAATRGVTLAGQAYVPQTPDGMLRGKRVSERLVRKSGAFRVLMPAGSAAIVTVPAG